MWNARAHTCMPRVTRIPGIAQNETVVARRRIAMRNTSISQDGYDLKFKRTRFRKIKKTSLAEKVPPTFIVKGLLNFFIPRKLLNLWPVFIKTDPPFFNCDPVFFTK